MPDNTAFGRIAKRRSARGALALLIALAPLLSIAGCDDDSAPVRREYNGANSVDWRRPPPPFPRGVPGVGTTSGSPPPAMPDYLGAAGDAMTATPVAPEPIDESSTLENGLDVTTRRIAPTPTPRRPGPIPSGGIGDPHGAEENPDGS